MVGGAEPSLSIKRITQKPMRVLHSTLHLLKLNPALRNVLGENPITSCPSLGDAIPSRGNQRGGRLGSSLALKAEGSIDYHRCRDLVPGRTVVLSRGLWYPVA